VHPPWALICTFAADDGFEPPVQSADPTFAYFVYL